MYTLGFNSPFLNNGMVFTTKDNDNDQRFEAGDDLAGDELNCAIFGKGGWWYNDCYQCNLNGLYYHGGTHFYNSSLWFSGKKLKGRNYEYFSIKECTMKIRLKM